VAVEGATTDRGKPDPNVVVPAAVKRAAERSEELSRQAAAAKAAQPPNANDPVRIANVPSNGQGNGNNGMVVTNFDPNNPNPPGESQLSVVGQQQTPPAAQTPPQEQPNFEHQFKSLQGRYRNTEEENKRMAGQIQDMQRLLAQVNAPPPPPAPNDGSGVRFTGPVAGRAPAPRRVTEKEITDYGQDLIDVVGRRGMEVIDATIAPELGRINSELQFLKQQVGGVRQTVAYDGQSRMYDMLKKEVPHWEQINSHPEFVRWLGVSDPLSGQIRHNMLIEAFNGQQTTRVVEFFRRFLADQATSGLQNNGQQPGMTINSGGTPQVDLMALAAPGRAKTGQTQVSPDRPIVERAEISQFYRDKALGHYKGRDDEVSRIEQEIFAASREGRIR
jgi:hypothetical protein